MSSPVWAITGFKVETFASSASKEKIVPDRVIGRLNETAETIMHGEISLRKSQRLEYAYIKASLLKMEDFESTPLAERGLGAVSGGFIVLYHISLKPNVTIVQEWGVVCAAKKPLVCGFYSADSTKFNLVMVCFDRGTVAAVSGFWRNGKVLIGPDIKCDKTEWGVNFRSHPDTGSYALVLEQGELWLVVWLPLLVWGLILVRSPPVNASVLRHMLFRVTLVRYVAPLWTIAGTAAETGAEIIYACG